MAVMPEHSILFRTRWWQQVLISRQKPMKLNVQVLWQSAIYKNYSFKLLIQWCHISIKPSDSGLILEDGNRKGGSCKTSNRSTSVIWSTPLSLLAQCAQNHDLRGDIPQSVSCSWHISVHRSVTVGYTNFHYCSYRRKISLTYWHF